MSDIIQNAANGQRKAMKILYETNKQKAYYVAECLLGKKGSALEAAHYAFKNVWSEITAHGITNKEEFTHLLIRKTVDYCKKQVSKSDQKAFRIPNNRNFLISVDEALEKETGNAVDEILNILPYMQRFIFILHTVGGYLPEQIASTFKLDMKTVGLALEAEKTNIERLTQHLGDRYTYEAVCEALRDAERDTEIPATLDERVQNVINNIAAPIENKKKKLFIIVSTTVFAAVLLIAGIVFATTRNNADIAAENDTSVSDTDSSADYSVISSPVIDLDESLTYYADIEIADYGTVTVKLDREAAPVTVANFVNLAQNGFYDGLTFHRIIEGFMMQGGDPNGDGTGGSDNCIVGEFTDNGYENSLSHTRGAISMARSSDYDSASSQFFIMHEDNTSLDGQYAVFGYVTEGLDIVDAVCESAEPIDDNGTIETEAQPVITSITIRTE